MEPKTESSGLMERASVVCDPTGRFERTNELLGRGAYKEVFKGFDQEEGVEVAWYQLKIEHISERNALKILSEIQILQSLKNDYIIEFKHSWIEKDEKNGDYKVFFITELMTSGTLKGYIKKTKGAVKPKVYKHWCRQILKGLLYLHSKQPPIIHRDLKCDNIFINGNNGHAKIGDLGLAIFKDKENMSSVLGTPEFMAPELYDEKYDEKVDVYAFGLCVLEICSKEYPYSECENAAQIFRKVTQGIKPAALAALPDEEVKQFIELCIESDPVKRPSVEDLLMHPFLSVCEDEISPIHGKEKDKAIACELTIEEKEASVLSMKMLVTLSSGERQEIKFPFNLLADTVEDVVSEMIRERVLSENARELVGEKIKIAVDEVKVEKQEKEAKEAKEEKQSEPYQLRIPSSQSTDSILQRPFICDEEDESLPAVLKLRPKSRSKMYVDAHTLWKYHGTDLKERKFHDKFYDESEPFLLSPWCGSSSNIEDAPSHEALEEMKKLISKQRKEYELLLLFHESERIELLEKLNDLSRKEGPKERAKSTPYNSISDETSTIKDTMTIASPPSAPTYNHNITINSGLLTVITGRNSADSSLSERQLMEIENFRASIKKESCPAVFKSASISHPISAPPMASPLARSLSASNTARSERSKPDDLSLLFSISDSSQPPMDPSLLVSSPPPSSSSSNDVVSLL